MNAPTPTASPLEGLLICGQCLEQIALVDEPRPRFACGRGCSTPGLLAGEFDTMIIGRILETVITPRNMATLLREANQQLADEIGPTHVMTAEDVEELTKNPDLLMQAAGSASEVRLLLGRFIEEIQVHGAHAVVRYSLPLPGDSPLAGLTYQEIDLAPDLRV